MWDDPGAAGRIMERIKAQLDPQQHPESRTLRGGHLSAMAHTTVERRASAAPLTLHGLSVEGVNQCVHCGLCLAYCPTFSELGTEMDSPRGRIFLIKSLAEGRMTLSDPIVRPSLALPRLPRLRDRVPGRRALRPADRGRQGRDRAPAARAARRRIFRWLNFGLLLGHPRAARARRVAALRLYQASGLQRLVRRESA